MKKKKTVKLLSLVLCLVFVASTFTILSSAKNYFDKDWQYTAVTDTSGSSMIDCYTYHYGVGDPDNYALIIGESNGGSASSFETTAFAQYNDGTRHSQTVSSDDTGRSRVTAQVSFYENDIIGGVTGYTEHWSTSKTNSSDYWRYNYLVYWGNCADGFYD